MNRAQTKAEGFGRFQIRARSAIHRLTSRMVELVGVDAKLGSKAHPRMLRHAHVKTNLLHRSKRSANCLQLLDNAMHSRMVRWDV